MAEASEDLSSEQTEQLLQFQDLTGIEDLDRCKTILERHNWDMEIAIQDRFNEEEGNPSVFEQRRDEPRLEREPMVDNDPIDIRRIIVPRAQPQGIVQWGYFAILFPFRFLFDTFKDIFYFILNLFRPDPRRNVVDPVGDVMKFIRMFNEHYSTKHPTFYQGTYSQALNDAKTELRFLLVYLHGDDHQDTPHFCQGTLGNQQLIEFINDRCLFWACNTNSPEGYRVSQALRESTYPFLALIVLRDNRMTVVAKIEGPVPANILVERLTRCIGDNEASLIAARTDREERSFNQTLREQQDEAYLLSLKADQEKARKKKDEENAKQQIENEKIKKEEEAHKRLSEIAERKEQLRRETPDEPDEEDLGAVTILLKLPNGTRLSRRFYRDQSLKYLFNYVFCHEDAPDDFQIITNFPRKVLSCEPTLETPEPLTFAEVGLGKKEMLFVHDNEA